MAKYLEVFNMKFSLALLFLVVSLYGISAEPAPGPEPEPFALPEPEADAGPAPEPEPLLGLLNGLRNILIVIIKSLAGLLITILG